MRKGIVKRALEEMKAARLQVDSIEQSLKKINPGVTKDTVRGSSPEFPYTEHPITVEGNSNSERIKLERQLERKRAEYYHKVRLAERAIREAEPEMQDILRRRYELGQSLEEIGEAIGYSKGRVSQKISEYFTKD